MTNASGTTASPASSQKKPSRPPSQNKFLFIYLITLFALAIGFFDVVSITHAVPHCVGPIFHNQWDQTYMKKTFDGFTFNALCRP
jgi:hypothetical protein